MLENGDDFGVSAPLPSNETEDDGNTEFNCLGAKHALPSALFGSKVGQRSKDPNGEDGDKEYDLNDYYHDKPWEDKRRRKKMRKEEEVEDK